MLVDPENPQEIAAKLATLAWDRPVVEDLRVRGLARARDWTWEKTAHLTSEVYHRVLVDK